MSLEFVDVPDLIKIALGTQVASFWYSRDFSTILRLSNIGNGDIGDGDID